MQAATEEQKEMLRKKQAEKQRELEELEAEQQERYRMNEEARVKLVEKKALRPAWGEGGAMKCGKSTLKWTHGLPRSNIPRRPISASRLSFLSMLSKDLQETVVSEAPFQSDFDRLAAGLRDLSSPPQPVIKEVRLG